MYMFGHLYPFLVLLLIDLRYKFSLLESNINSSFCFHFIPGQLRDTSFNHVLLIFFDLQFYLSLYSFCYCLGIVELSRRYSSPQWRVSLIHFLRRNCNFLNWLRFRSLNAFFVKVLGLNFNCASLVFLVKDIKSMLLRTLILAELSIRERLTLSKQIWTCHILIKGLEGDLFIGFQLLSYAFQNEQLVKSSFLASVIGSFGSMNLFTLVKCDERILLSESVSVL